ncbi:hypothetical protein CWI37_1058p0020 [Hamiltosporidium tvaerminnensis]|uniref:Uncharacterized protein n=1 Tax=Hamiltosporidium tvaerminnensis TaxID=1176355 RepID=A0A4Q9KZ29_9MICR|nr:hypothetical protein CWI37_1058p0020 [Hamiltosporidium tvaerminnensis]
MVLKTENGSSGFSNDMGVKGKEVFYNKEGREYSTLNNPLVTVFLNNPLVTVFLNNPLVTVFLNNQLVIVLVNNKVLTPC